MQKSQITIIFIVIALVSLIVYNLNGGSVCIFYNVYGLPCPTCGMTRAYIEIFNFNVKNAFVYHPLFWLVPFLILSYKSKKYLYLIFIIFISIWFLRLYLYFPNGANKVFNFNENAIFPKIYKTILKK